MQVLCNQAELRGRHYLLVALLNYSLENVIDLEYAQCCLQHVKNIFIYSSNYYM